MNHICFIGGGNMTQAILGGLLASGQPASAFTVIEPAPAARAKLAQTGVAVHPQWLTPLQPYQMIVLAVKPQVVHEALAAIDQGPLDAVLLSIAAGVRTDTISSCLNGHQRIIRAMPNTPALIGAGITALFATTAATAQDRLLATALLGAVGATLWVDQEQQLDAVTAVSGSGPAYVFYLIEALEAAAIELGLSSTVARQLAIETFRGSALLAASSTESPASLRANVTSKGGTTERALQQFARDELGSRMIKGVKAAAQRAAELGQELAGFADRGTHNVS